MHYHVITIGALIERERERSSKMDTANNRQNIQREMTIRNLNMHASSSSIFASLLRIIQSVIQSLSIVKLKILCDDVKLC